MRKTELLAYRFGRSCVSISRCSSLLIGTPCRSLPVDRLTGSLPATAASTMSGAIRARLRSLATYDYISPLQPIDWQ